MKREFSTLLALAMVLPACSAAPPETPGELEFGDTRATQTEALTKPAVPASFWTTSAPGVTSGYVSLPGGDQVSKKCIFFQKPGEAP